MSARLFLSFPRSEFIPQGGVGTYGGRSASATWPFVHRRPDKTSVLSGRITERETQPDSAPAGNWLGLNLTQSVKSICSHAERGNKKDISFPNVRAQSKMWDMVSFVREGLWKLLLIAPSLCKRRGRGMSSNTYFLHSLDPEKVGTRKAIDIRLRSVTKAEPHLAILIHKLRVQHPWDYKWISFCSEDFDLH